MKGRIFKFRLDDKIINNNMDNFLFNIVNNRQRNQIYLTSGRVAFNTLEENDYILTSPIMHPRHSTMTSNESNTFFTMA